MDVRNRQQNLGFGTIGVRTAIREGSKFATQDKAAVGKVEQIITYALNEGGFSTVDGSLKGLKSFFMLSHPTKEAEEALSKKIVSAGGDVLEMVQTCDTKAERALAKKGYAWLDSTEDIKRSL